MNCSLLIFNISMNFIVGLISSGVIYPHFHGIVYIYRLCSRPMCDKKCQAQSRYKHYLVTFLILLVICFLLHIPGRRYSVFILKHIKRERGGGESETDRSLEPRQTVYSIKPDILR